MTKYVIRGYRKTYHCCLAINDIFYQSAMGIYINVFLEILNLYNFCTYTYRKNDLSDTDLTFFSFVILLIFNFINLKRE